VLKFRSQGIRIGTLDLKIAAITIAHDATLLTRNTVDFAKVPGLRFENWLD
jgi:tRNA(fMet)-specific endonuclease VapC